MAVVNDIIGRPPRLPRLLRKLSRSLGTETGPGNSSAKFIQHLLFSVERVFSGMESSSATKLHSKTGHRAAEISPTRNCQPHGLMWCDLDDCGSDVVDVIMSFVGIHAYLSVASVSTRWRHAWGKRPKVTSPKWAVQSSSCLDWAIKCSFDTYDRPCLLAAAEGRLKVLRHAVALGYSREGIAICERAAAGGHLEVVKWCRANGYPWGLSKLLAAEGGHLEVLQWCTASKAPDVSRRSLVEGPCRGPGYWLVPGTSETEVLNAAVKSGNLETVMWCIEQGYRWNENTCYLAAKWGHMDLLRWLRDNGCPWSKFTMIATARAGDVEMLEWCRANDCPWTGHVNSTAARRGNLEIVKWCVANHPEGGIRNTTCCDAAAGGHLKVVQWLRGVGCRWGKGLCFSAACGGHFEVLKWCIMNGCPWDDVPRDALGYEFNGTVAMMAWAAANRCPWMTDRSAVNSLCWHAARGGNLDVLKWCAMNHRIASSKALETVARNGHVHVLEWLRANTGVLGRYMDMDISLCSMAALSGSLETVKWCRANGYPWCQKTCTAAATSGNLELLQWCRANGCPWGDDTCETVIQRGDFEMLAWCREKGCPLDGRWRESSLWGGYAEMIEWCWKSSPSKSSAQAIRRSSPHTQKRKIWLVDFSSQ